MTASPDNELRCMEVFGGNRTVSHELELPGLDVCLSARQAGGGRGGDLHYLSTCGRGEIIRLMVADVSGHGASVADVATRFRQLILRNINRLDQSRMVRRMNRALVADAEGGRFVTSVFATWHRPSEHLVICNAGHQRPLLRRAGSAAWSLLDYRIENTVDSLLNIPLGIIHPTEYYQFAVRLFPGDMVLMYTDGVCDNGPRSGVGGEQNLVELLDGLAGPTPERLVAELQAALVSLPGRPNGVDDETILAFSPTTRPFPALSTGERLRSLARMAGVLPVPVH